MHFCLDFLQNMDYSHNMSVIARQPYILRALFQLLLYSQNDGFNESPFRAFWFSRLFDFRGFLVSVILLLNFIFWFFNFYCHACVILTRIFVLLTPHKVTNMNMKEIRKHTGAQATRTNECQAWYGFHDFVFCLMNHVQCLYVVHESTCVWWCVHGKLFPVAMTTRCCMLHVLRNSVLSEKHSNPLLYRTKIINSRSTSTTAESPKKTKGGNQGRKTKKYLYALSRDTTTCVEKQERYHGYENTTQR